MKLSHISFIGFALAGLVATSSCIRDEIPDCPPLRVNIVVKDKNYVNVDKVELEERLDEDLPFRNYVPTLYWVLRDINTGDVVDASDGLIRVTGDGLSVRPDICPCVPHGRYVLTVWGGLESNTHLSENMDLITFHPGNTQGADVYMTNDTIFYDPSHNDYTVELERTKGKLIVEKLNVPEDFKHTEKNISGIYGTLSHHDFKYGGQTYVKAFTDIADRTQTVSKTLLTPSLQREGTLLNVKFLGEDAGMRQPILDTKNVKITMRRNELTVVRYAWDAAEGRFKIYVLLNDAWEMVNVMGVE